MKKIPYGKSNFRQIILDDALYIDKTKYIELLEESYTHYPIFLRPRRFGKSLFLSTLSYYYDEKYKDESEEMFGNLYIGKNPTANKSSYRILHFDFSGITTKSYESVYSDFTINVKVALEKYLLKYGYDERLDMDSPANLMKKFFLITREDKIYLLVDEYDHFANGILANSLDKFMDIIGKGGFVRSFYETIKTATGSGIVERLFITGITSITLDSMMSGFNITDNISIDEKFNSLIGFTMSETKLVLQNIFEVCKVDKEKIFKDVTDFYDGYRFSENATEDIYNSDMVLYFVKKFDKKRCLYPQRMLDDNIASDYRVIMKFFNIGDTQNNYRVLQEIINTNQVRATIKRKFDIDKNFSENDFITLLFYMGFLTISGNIFSITTFKIPNNVIKRLYFNYFQVEIEKREEIKFNTKNIENSIINLAIKADIQNFQKELENIWIQFSNRDMIKLEEKNVKAIILTVLNLTDFYLIKSEAEENKLYPDVMLLERSPYKVNYQFLFELKFAKKGKWDEQKIEGIEQVETYLALPSIQRLQNLKSYLIIADSQKLEIIEVN